MYLVLKKEWEVQDGSTPDSRNTTIPKGRHEIERIRDPCGFKGSWLVLKGTKIGMQEARWREWVAREGVDFEDDEVVIEGDIGRVN